MRSDVYICMEGFKGFVKEDEDVAKTLRKIPPHHQALVRGYKFVFEPGNTLHGDKGHVGMIVSRPRKLVRIAGPWRYSREFTVLHEIAHLVYEMYVRGTPVEKKWADVALNTPGRKMDEPAEELFCHAYAAMFADHPPGIHRHQEWIRFLKNVNRIKTPSPTSRIKPSAAK